MVRKRASEGTGGVEVFGHSRRPPADIGLGWKRSAPMSAWGMPSTTIGIGKRGPPVGGCAR
jgi:hypothetical protein